MNFEDALVTTTTALGVASALDHFVKEGITDQHFQICVRGAGGEERDIWVRPLLSQDFIPSADQSQVIKCIADDGRRVDILLPQHDLRGSNPACIVIGAAV